MDELPDDLTVEDFIEGSWARTDRELGASVWYRGHIALPAEWGFESHRSVLQEWMGKTRPLEKEFVKDHQVFELIYTGLDHSVSVREEIDEVIESLERLVDMGGLVYNGVIGFPPGYKMITRMNRDKLVIRPFVELPYDYLQLLAATTTSENHIPPHHEVNISLLRELKDKKNLFKKFWK